MLNYIIKYKGRNFHSVLQFYSQMSARLEGTVPFLPTKLLTYISRLTQTVERSKVCM